MSTDAVSLDGSKQGAHRRRRAPGERSRRRVLERAVELASVGGLEGLSIGALAAAAEMPKSSVYALFGSKRELQLATVDAAGEIFAAEVIAPALADTPGSHARLLALCERYLSYLERRVFPGGCFFVNAAAELCGRSGPLRDRVASYQRRWRQLLGEAASDALSAGAPAGDESAEQIAFELDAILTGMAIAAVLEAEEGVIERARRAIERRVEE